jgi:hypothetical protein
MAESFITVLNGVITGKHHGDINAELYGTPYYGHEKTEVPFDAEVTPLEPTGFYTPVWKRKPDCRLIDEGLLPMPKGYVREGGELRPMSPEERVVAGLDGPPPGYKVVEGGIVPMSLREQAEAGQIAQEDYESRVSAENAAELQRRLAGLQTPEALAQAEIDKEHAAKRKTELAALLAVKKQPGWPLTVKWPEA